MKKLILLSVPLLLFLCAYTAWKRKVYYDA